VSRANPLTTHDNAGIAAWRFKLSHKIDSFGTAYDAEQEIYSSLCPADIDKMVKLLPDLNGYRYGYKIGPQMWVADRGDYMAVWLYDTEIIRYYPDDTFSVDNGSFNTPTTSERLTAVLPSEFIAFHHRKKLGLSLIGHGGNWPGPLWPLNHSTRIDLTTGQIVEGS
jgi:hypothetical protein